MAHARRRHLLLGLFIFVALWAIFEFRSFKDVIAAGRADREAGSADAAEGPTAAPAAPRARA